MAQCYKILFPLIEMVKELSGAAGLPLGGPLQMKITLHEVNSGVLILKKTIPPEFIRRSKFYALKPFGFGNNQSCESRYQAAMLWHLYTDATSHHLRISKEIDHGMKTIYFIVLGRACPGLESLKRYKIHKAWEGVLICAKQREYLYSTRLIFLKAYSNIKV